jgi:hypothetical protein
VAQIGHSLAQEGCDGVAQLVCVLAQLVCAVAQIRVQRSVAQIGRGEFSAYAKNAQDDAFTVYNMCRKNYSTDSDIKIFIKERSRYFGASSP